MTEIARLTDRQILEVYYHARDKETGAIEAPEPEAAERGPATLESELLALRQIAGPLRIPAEKLAELEARIREKYGNEPR